MKIIEDKDFVDYFLVVADAMRSGPRITDIGVGPARGSSAGSLACWLLASQRSTRCCTRTTSSSSGSSTSHAKDLPDVDVDFQQSAALRSTTTSSASTERSVGNVGTFTKFKGKNSLDAAARVFHVPVWESRDNQGRSD
jgi:DNA polymerase-3 subunit alpha